MFVYNLPKLKKGHANTKPLKNLVKSNKNQFDEIFCQHFEYEKNYLETAEPDFQLGSNHKWSRSEKLTWVISSTLCTGTEKKREKKLREITS